MESLKGRSLIAWAGIILSLCWMSPNFVKFESIPSWWPFTQKLNYGLDIQGGLHLVMGVDVEGVVRESAQRLVLTLRQDLENEKAQAEVTAVRPEQGEIQITTANAEGMTIAKKYIEDRWGTTLQEIDSSGNQVTYRYYDSYLTDYKQKLIEQAIETIRNRIDEFGVAEPSISQQGQDRILVQLPGMADAERAKQLINTTARLDFMIVSEEMDVEKLRAIIAEAEKKGEYSMSTLKYSDYVTRLNEDIKSQLPENTVVYFEKAENAKTMEAGNIPYLLTTDTNLGGQDLDSANLGYDQYGKPDVALQFTPSGAGKFATLTEKNVNRRMAIVLDRVVKSAPNIRERIGGGRASISLGAGDHQQQMEEGRMIATALRAGALPATLDQLEERRVGPSLGSDSIQEAKIASYIGAALIVIFMIIYYKGMGVIASVVLAVNILMLMALLTSLGATLTLPGIAGIALTVGFAVDANVLINERLREELRKGGTFKLAANEGYSRALSAILDANITTGLTAVILLYFGTGPVRGFAVTLLIGIFTTMFANVFISRVIVDVLIQRFRVQKISV